MLTRRQIGGRARTHPLPLARCGVPTRVDPDEAVRIGVRQRVEEHRFDDAEHGRVGADAQRERQDGEQREERGTPRRSYGKAHVLPQVPQPLRPPPLCRVLPVDCTHCCAPVRDVAEPAQRLGARLVGGTAARHQLGGAHLEVEGDLVLDLGVDRRAVRREPEGAADAVGQGGRHALTRCAGP
jgi:hypothetical protein